MKELFYLEIMLAVVAALHAAQSCTLMADD